MHYEYETIEMDNNPLYQAHVVENEHRRIIDEQAAAGHRFAGYIPIVSGANGKILSFDLVFEASEA